MILFSDIVFSAKVLVGLAAFHFRVSEDFAVAEALCGADLDAAPLDAAPLALEAEDSGATLSLMILMCGRSRNIVRQPKLNLAAIFHQKMSAHIMRGRFWKISLPPSLIPSQMKARLAQLKTLKATQTGWLFYLLKPPPLMCRVFYSRA